MSEQKPSIGRIVLFRLSDQDAEQINRRRTNGPSIAERIKAGTWPIGAQAHIGNEVTGGDVFPMVISRVWTETTVNGQAFIDGNDAFWVLSATFGDGAHQWGWPPRV